MGWDRQSVRRATLVIIPRVRPRSSPAQRYLSLFFCLTYGPAKRKNYLSHVSCLGCAAPVSTDRRRKSMDSTQRTRPRTGGSPVGLVIFIILAAVFAVLAYWGYAKYQQAQTEIAGVNAKLNTANTSVTRLEGVNRAFTQATGVPAADALKPYLDSALAAAQTQNIGADVTVDARNALDSATKAVTSLTQTVESQQQQIATLDSQVKTLTEQNAASAATYSSGAQEKDATIVALTKKMNDENPAAQYPHRPGGPVARGPPGRVLYAARRLERRPRQARPRDSHPPGEAASRHRRGRHHRQGRRDHQRGRPRQQARYPRHRRHRGRQAPDAVHRLYLGRQP